jgi:hypothetical protein
MIHYNIPWATDKNLSGAYNRFMKMIPDDDWACFVDGDARFTTNFWGKQIEMIVNLHGDKYNLMTCYTNRVGTPYQCLNGTWDYDEKQNREIGEALFKAADHHVQDITNRTPISGVLILCKKSLWHKFGGLPDGMLLGADNEFHYGAQRVGAKVGLMTGVYVEHWYRGGRRENKSHLL